MKTILHVKDNFTEIKRELKRLEAGGGCSRVHVRVSNCTLDEYIWLKQKKSEGLICELTLTKAGRSKFPSVAILMFTFDRIEYTREALGNLIKNTRYPFDLYIVDNHSTDGTREWLEIVRLECPDIIKDIRYNSHNEGLPGPTNDFWSRVDSELIGKVDNDTLVPPGWLERMVEAHQKVPKLAVIGGYHFRPEDFDDQTAKSRLYVHNGIKILPDRHIGGCCYLMKKSIQQKFGLMKYNPALKIHGWTEYQHILEGEGYIVGYLYPLIQLEYMDDPRSKKCLINKKYKDYTRKIWRERGINFKSTDQIIEWLHRDALRVNSQSSIVATSSESKKQQTGKSYYCYARPEIQAIVSRKAKKILDIGCGAGVLGMELKNRQKCYVAGIEYVPEVADKAETVLDRVYKGDAVKIIAEIPKNSFDTVIMADFLEHVADSEKMISDVKRILMPGGTLVLSIPNVRHWSVIKDLLEGRWEYRDAGILDKTHLRFFTWQSIMPLLNSAGYDINSCSGTYLKGCDVPEEFINLSKLCGIDTSSLAREGRIYQYLITCTSKKVENESSNIMIQKQTNSQNQFTSIIILTHNQLEYTKKCINSIFKHTKETFELIVVDNGSTDGTVEYLESEAGGRGQAAGARIRIIKNKENLGFAAGNNQGMAAAKGDYILLMNNDIVVTPGWLERLITCAERKPQIGIVGPVSNYVSGPQLIRDVTYNTSDLDGLDDFATEFSNRYTGNTKRFIRVVGFCMLIKRAVIDKIGGLDARYGLGNFEDDDFSLRAALAGFESWIAQDCFVHHFGSRTFGGAKIDYRESLRKNWEIYKKKWGMPADLAYGSSYDLSFLLKDGFIHSKHYVPIGKMADLETGNAKETAPNSIQENYYEIQQLIAKGKKQEAREALEKLSLDTPDFALAHNDLGVLYFQEGDKTKALKHYERAVALQPENVTFLKNLADFYYVESGSVEDAMKLYVKVLGIVPEDMETLLVIGHICVSLKKFDDAKTFYNRVLRADPVNEDARRILAKLLKREQDIKPNAHVSVIIQTSTQQKYIKKCVESIQRHTAEPYEIIFVNNKATKGTAKWLKEKMNENSNYHMVKCTKDAGLAESFNEGIKASTGEHILLLSNDVIVTKGWLSGMLECLKSVSDAGVAGPMSNISFGRQKVPAACNVSVDQIDEFAETFRKRNCSRRISTFSLDCFCMLFKRNLVEKIGFFDEQFGFDGFETEDFCVRALLEGHQNLIAGDVYVHQQNKKVFSRNKKYFNTKWNKADAKSDSGKKYLAVKAIEKGIDLFQKGFINNAVEVLLEGIGLAPDTKRTYYILAEILISSKNYKDAIEVLNEMPPDESDIKRLELLGYCKEGLELDKEASDIADKILLIDDNYAPALNLKGKLAFRQKDLVLAEDFFNRAIKSDQGYGETYTNLGAILWNKNRAEALNYFEKGLILSPADQDIIANYHFAVTATGEYERAESVFQEAAFLYPNNKMIKYQFVDVLINQGKNAEAMRRIEEAVALFGADDGLLSAALKIRDLLGPKKIDKTKDKKHTVSLCMIVKNEQDCLAGCLNSVKPVVDEMIVVDTGSDDKTIEIARIFGAKVYDFKWNGDFSEARNFSLSKASGNWILLLDADEVISSFDYEAFRKTVRQSDPKKVAFLMNTRNYVMDVNQVGWVANDGHYEKEETGTGWLPSEKARLFCNDPDIRFEYPVHELVEPSLGKAGIALRKTGIPVHHYGKLNKEKSAEKMEVYYQIGRKKLDKMGDNEVALRELAIQAQIIKKHDEAIELWERFIAIKPNFAGAYINMGISYCSLGKYDKVFETAKKAIKLEPDLKEAHYNCALAMLHLGNSAEAVSTLETLLDRLGEYPPARFLLAAAYCCEGEKDKGINELKGLQKTSIGPGLPNRCRALAKELASSGRHDYATIILEAAIDSKNSNRDVMKLYSECLGMMNINRKTETTVLYA